MMSCLPTCAGSPKTLITSWRRLNDDHSLYSERDKQAKPGAGIHEPILWITEFGKGRVFVTALGHDPDDTENPAFKITFARGAEWATTGKVTIPVPPELAK
jgi:type 1 glutamine amidotransferase